MKRFGTLPRKFRSFENAVLEPIRAYSRNHDEDLLRKSARAVKALFDQVDEHVVPLRQEVLISGWLTPQWGYRLTRRTLRKLNPGYKVSVVRVAREDVIVAGKPRRQRFGFHVCARGATSLPQFVFGVVSQDGNIVSLPASNFDVAERLKYGARGQETAVSDLKDRAQPPFGYVDNIIQSLIPVSSEPNTWFDALVHRSPREILELADSEGGRFFAPEAARLLGKYPIDAFWADRLNLSAHGSSGSYTSDLMLLSVSRPNPMGTPAPGTGLHLPVMEHYGAVIKFVAGPTVMRQPSQKWLRYENAFVQDGGTLVVGDQLISYEAAADPCLDFVAGQWETVFGSRHHPDSALLRKREYADKVIPEGILLSGRNDSNWFHWLVEYLPRLTQIDDSVGADVPVVVSSRTPETGIAALRSLTNREIVVLDAELAHRVDVIHVIAPPVQILDTTRVPWAQGLSMNPGPLHEMRAQLGVTKLLPPTRRVFLQRQSAHRGLRNEVELTGIARRHGLEILDPSTMTWAEQLTMFSTTSLLVGASGAVMANYILMAPGSSILALTSEALGDFVLPAAIASAVGAHFSYVTGPTVIPLIECQTRNAWLHSDFTVGATDFEAALITALARDSDYRANLRRVHT